jgi:hypothetical protein
MKKGRKKVSKSDRKTAEGRDGRIAISVTSEEKEHLATFVNAVGGELTPTAFAKEAVAMFSQISPHVFSLVRALRDIDSPRFGKDFENVLLGLIEERFGPDSPILAERREKWSQKSPK